MVSLRLPFSFSQPPKPANNGRAHGRSGSFSGATVACSAAAAAGASVAISQNPNNRFVQNALNFWLSNFSPNSNRFSPAWGSLSLAADQSPVTEPKTGVSFPAVLGDSQRLLGIGLRKKSLLGLKNIDIYAFVDGKEVGSVQRKLLCRSLLDLYIGDEPFDRPAKDDIERKLVSVIQM